MAFPSQGRHEIIASSQFYREEAFYIECYGVALSQTTGEEVGKTYVSCTKRCRLSEKRLETV
jgi:hypothetical protein